MNDCFHEDIIQDPSGLRNVLYLVCWGVLIGFGLYAVVLLQLLLYSFSVRILLLGLVCAAAAVLLFFGKDYLKVEYDYTFTNGILEFARVLRGARRKELGSMNVANVSACGHVAGKSFERYLSMKDVERKNWFLHRDGNLFYFYYEKEGRKHMIIAEPSEETVGMIRRYLPAGIYQD